MEGGSASVVLALPIVLGIEAEIVDKYGEIVKVKADVKVNQATQTNWTAAVEKIQKLTDPQT